MLAEDFINKICTPGGNGGAGGNGYGWDGSSIVTVDQVAGSNPGGAAMVVAEVVQVRAALLVQTIRDLLEVQQVQVVIL